VDDPGLHSALADLRRRAAVTVVCSRYETFGLTATEAMSQGCPLVVTAAGALSEIVQDGVNGLVCRPNDPGDLAEKLCLLLGSPPYAERLGCQAAIDSRQRYNPDLLATRSVDYYQCVIARARTKQGISPVFL
jgi:glycosyltransferase involved in cell wall biosynthesis